MSCLEHTCVECGTTTFDNAIGVHWCESCGARCTTHFDEDEHDPQDNYEEEEDDEY